jgi:hypothetical protein
MQAGESRIGPLRHRWYQHIHRIPPVPGQLAVPLMPGQAMSAQRRRTGEHARGPGVEQRRHLAFIVGGAAGVGQVNTRKKSLPRARFTAAVRQDPLGHPAFENLRPSNHAALLSHQRR